MAKIKLNPDAAHAVITSLRSADLSFDVSQCDCFANHDSQSQMMPEFERRVNDVRNLIMRYQELLANDVHALESSCNAIIANDNMHAVMHSFLGQGPGHHGNGSSGGFGGRGR